MTTQEEILFTSWGGEGCAFKHTSDLKAVYKTGFTIEVSEKLIKVLLIASVKRGLLHVCGGAAKFLSRLTLEPLTMILGIKNTRNCNIR